MFEIPGSPIAAQMNPALDLLENVWTRVQLQCKNWRPIVIEK